MDITMRGGERRGTVAVPSSKSMAHRLLIAAALGKDKVGVRLDGMPADIRATADCLASLAEGRTECFCGESASTLRFLLPVAAAKGKRAAFVREGRLPCRPIAPLVRTLEAHGARIIEDGKVLQCEGQLTPGEYTIPGNVSSQFISGLLFALPLLAGESRIRITDGVESKGYIGMTLQILALAGVRVGRTEDGYIVPGRQAYQLPENVAPERDWSAAAFPLAMGALSRAGVSVCGMESSSAQGDRAIMESLRAFGAVVTEEGGRVTVRKGDLTGIRLDARDIPDLVPCIAAVAALSAGETVIRGAARLRDKESDRLRATARLLTCLGGDARETADGLIIIGKESLPGGVVDPARDHRIAMAAAVAACGCAGDVTIRDAECVTKSWPLFWEEVGKLEGEA